MGLVNAVVPLDDLEQETVAWCREMSHLSPLALRLLKSSFNAEEDGLTGLQQLSHDATLLFYMTEEGQEGRNAYQQGRKPDFSKYPRDRAVSPLRIWLMAARPRTLPAAIAPVLVGTAAAVVRRSGSCRGCGAVRRRRWSGSIFIQIGTNLANDYSDAKRGADTADRLGPVRVTAPGLVAPKRVLYATWVAFAIAAACGIYLATVAGPVIIVVGVVSILAGVLYTGGPRPYGYAGLGELFVFLFFGLVAVNGSYYVQLERAGLAAVRALGRDRRARHGDPGRQQHPRHRHRPPRGQEHAGGPPRARTDPEAVHGPDRRRLRRAADHPGRRGRPLGRDARSAVRAACAAGAEPGPEPDRRPGPERRAGRDRRLLGVFSLLVAAGLVIAA